jgi:hypothetical protein
VIKVASLFAAVVMAGGALCSCLPEEQTTAESIEEYMQSVESVDDVIDGARACLGFSLDWDDWLRRTEANGWKKLKAVPRTKISETETSVAAVFVNKKQMIQAHFNFMKLDFPHGAKGMGRCTTYSNLKTAEDAEIAGSKIISTFSIPELDPPSSSINLQSGESINYSVQGVTDKGVFYATIINS